MCHLKTREKKDNDHSRAYHRGFLQLPKEEEQSVGRRYTKCRKREDEVLQEEVILKGLDLCLGDLLVKGLGFGIDQ